MDSQSVSNTAPDGLFTQPRPNPQNYIDDMSSRKGKFGWVTVKGIHLPYILRNGEKYVAVRMSGKKIIDKFTSKLSSHVYAYNRIKAYFITESEAILLDEINNKHLEGAFGKGRFTKKDLITELEDTIRFCDFVHFCYTKVSNVQISIKSNCGFIQIGSRIVPYINMNGNRFVPLLFFDSLSESLKTKCINVESWDWAYLKFYCNIIGTKHSELPLKSCPVINVVDIQQLLQHTEEYKFFVPLTIKDSSFLVKDQKCVNIPWFVIAKEP